MSGLDEPGEGPLRPSGLSFGTAVKAMKGGARCARAGWNGKGMFVFYVGQGHLTIAFADGVEETMTVLPHLMMRTVTGDLIPWLSSQTDTLADDWMLV